MRFWQHHLFFQAKLFSLVLLAALITNGCSKKDASKASAPPPLPVEVKTLSSQTVQNSTEFVGTLQSEQAINLVPQINGQLTQILVNSGAQVKQGTPLFLIAPNQALPNFQSTVETVQANTAARQTAIANLESARANLDVAIQQAQAKKSELAAKKSDYELAKWENQRVQYLAEKKVDTQLNAQKAANKESVSRDAVTTAQKELAAAQQQVAAAQGQVAAAQSTVRQSEANIRQAEAQSASAKVDVNFKRVAAPIDGTVGNITLNVGDYVNTNTVLTTINTNDAFDLQIPVPLSRTNQLRSGLPVQLLDPNTNEKLATGSIYFVSPTTDTRSQAIITRARFVNSNGKLRNNQYVKARIIWQSQPGVVVPTLAVTSIGPQSFVFVPQERTVDGKTEVVAHQVPVTLGGSQGDNYPVISGLKPGDKVIVSDILRLQDGLPITPKSAGSKTQSSSGAHPGGQSS